MPEPSRTPRPPVGGSALPFGVMMRAGEQVAVAVRRPDGVAVETFPAPPVRLSSWRASRWPFVRALFSLRASGATARQALEVMSDLVSAGTPSEPGRLGAWARIIAVVFFIGGFAIQTLVFRLGPIVIAKELGLVGAAFILAEAAIRLTLLIGALRLVALAPQARRLLAYHGAEHMAIASLEAGDGVSARAAARHSRFHPRCGTSFLVGSSLISVLVYGAALALTGAFSYPALILTRLALWPVVAAIALEAQRVVSRGQGRIARILGAPGMATQRLTTAAPRTEELEVACVALEAALGRPGPARVVG